MSPPVLPAKCRATPTGSSKPRTSGLGTYTVTATLSGFKKVQRTGVVLRAASVVLADLHLDVGGLEDVVTVTAEGQNNITLESQSIARGLDEQQLRDLPRNSRDIQDFLTLNPNVVGGFDGIQFLGGRTYGASYIQDGQPSSAGIFGELSNAAPGLDAIQEVQVLSNSYSAEYGGLAGVIVSTKRGANRFRGTSFYDYNSNELNARTYAQALNGVSRDDPNADTHDYRYGFSLGGPLVTNRTFFFGNYEGSKLKALGGGSQAVVPTAAMRGGDFSANNFVIRDPLTGVQFPGNRIPVGSDRSGGAADPGLLLSAAEPAVDGHRRLWRVSSDPARSTATATAPTSASITSSPAATRCSRASAGRIAIPTPSRSRAPAATAAPA